MRSTVVTLDSLGMFALASMMPEQVEAAAGRASDVSVALDPAAVENVVIIGMGGSGMAGEVVSAVAAPLLPVPVVLARSYECPAFVGTESLVFAISASGETEETIQAASDAQAAGAHLVVVTSGGQLAELAAAWDAPVIRVPAGFPQPRAALGAMAIPPLLVLDHMGLYRGGRAWIEAAVDQLKRRRDELDQAGESSYAAVVARRIGRRWP